MLFSAQLPPELVLTILSHLPLQSLHTLRRLSREWLSWFDANQSYIYQHAALKHAFIPSENTLLKNAVLASKHLLPDDSAVNEWRTFCQLRFSLEAKWAGIGHPSWKELSADHRDVHRIKVDEEIGIVITTHKDGGINVRDIHTDEVLWALPRTYVQQYAHCEYEKGFLIWNRGDSKEVWRLASQYESSPSPPDELQQLISFTINRYMPTSKGHFKPWAILNPPESGRAFRFVYPTLLVANMNMAWLFDVERCELVKTISDIQRLVSGSFLGTINYVELSERYAFVCGSFAFRIFDRSSGALVHSITQEDIASEASRKQGVTFHRHQDPPHGEAVTMLPLDFHLGTGELETVDELEFVGVHVDSKGTAVVIMLSDSRLLVISDINRFLEGNKQLGDNGLAMQINFYCPTHEPLRLPPRGVYLAVEHGKVGVITNFGIFLITLDSSLHGLTDRDIPISGENSIIASPMSHSPTVVPLPLSHIKACRLLPFSGWAPLSAVSCLQMTARKMLFAWSHHYSSQNPKIILGDSPDSDTIIGYNGDGDRILVNMIDLQAVFADLEFFDQIEEAEGGSVIMQLLDGAAETTVSMVDFSPS
ncbi:hypothetical protein BDY19DRAFT_992179 [Irpex rosettiformis]|uniref:Uncharacterized protein n=1 Tax=Irpex rosettiformis TaxID=378272 RepID=A0ACB8U9A1_9APHY|nr:hypothetical protein BDY19DRAFT_992179 [Irpex rosettiformis]